MAYDYETISTRYDEGILTATIDNPPINVMTPPLFQDLMNFTEEVQQDEDVRVVVFESADPGTRTAHG